MPLRRAEEAGIIERAGGRRPLHASASRLDGVRERLGGRTPSSPCPPCRPDDRPGRAGPPPGAGSVRSGSGRRGRARERRPSRPCARALPDAAADLAEHACEMTPSLGRRRAASPAPRRRRIPVRRRRRWRRAPTPARDDRVVARAGPERAEMLYRLASMSWMNLIDGVRSPCEQALAEAGDDAEPAERDPRCADLGGVLPGRSHGGPRACA